MERLSTESKLAVLVSVACFVCYHFNKCELHFPEREKGLALRKHLPSCSRSVAEVTFVCVLGE